MNKILVVVAFLAVLTVTGCLPGDGAVTYQKPAGFLSGFWHGWLCWLSLIIGVFNDNIRIYETINSGWWYDLGYLLGIGTIGGSAVKYSYKR